MTRPTNTSHQEDIQDDWELESAAKRPGVKRGSVVVSVRLPRDDFDSISRSAEAAGVATSTFLRKAALEKVEGNYEASVVYWNGGAAANFTTTAVFGPTTSADLEAVVLV